MPITYTVKAGDTLSAIALEHGFYTLETIVNQPENEALFSTKFDPNDLTVGEQITIPDKTPKTVELRTFGPDDDPDRKYTFIRKSLKVEIWNILEDDDGDPYAGKAYEIKTVTQDGEQVYSGTTDENGQLREVVSPLVQSYEITLWPDKEADLANTVIWPTFVLGAAEAENEI